MTLNEFIQSLRNKHDAIQDEITNARKQQDVIAEKIAQDRLYLIDWIIGEANKVEFHKPKMREFL
jgi:hypothetical protein